MFFVNAFSQFGSVVFHVVFNVVVVILVFPLGYLHVEISVKLLRVYTKWSLVLNHICAGGGNVTFVVLRTFGAR